MSKDLYQSGSLPGFRNWVPEFDYCKISGRPISQWRPKYATINMHLLIEIRHDILLQCHGNPRRDMEVKAK